MTVFLGAHRLPRQRSLTCPLPSLRLTASLPPHPHPRRWEREGGTPGDVTSADVRAILDKYRPAEADRRAYREAKAAGKLDQYFAARAAHLQREFGDANVFTAAQAAGGR